MQTTMQYITHGYYFKCVLYEIQYLLNMPTDQTRYQALLVTCRVCIIMQACPARVCTREAAAIVGTARGNQLVYGGYAEC